jgi:hypothetical protein
MKQNSVQIKHKVVQAGSVDVPHVKGVADAAVQLVVHEDVGGSEVPWHIAHKATDNIFEWMPNILADITLVERKVVALEIRRAEVSLE